MRSLTNEQVPLFTPIHPGIHATPNYRLGATLAAIGIVVPWALVAWIIWTWG